MDIHEYQAKELLKRFGVQVPRGGIAYSPEQAVYRASELSGERWVVKAQIHSGARGKAGGVRICSSEEEIADAAQWMLGRKLVTHQTGPQGKLVSRLYVEEATNIAQEIYLGLVMDRKLERVVVVASAQGGMEIEEISANEPDSIIRSVVDPAVGMQAFQAREIAFSLGLEPPMIAQAVKTILGCYALMSEMDANMVEINPMVVTRSGEIVALDAKISFDDNALFRRPEISELRDKSQEDSRETFAEDRGLSYIGLDGRIGCIVNGAGLAMATLDMIKTSGGEPANFLDVGGGASPERVLMSFKAVLNDRNVEAILVNIFAGINRCDWIAEGVIRAVRELELTMPLVVRLGHQCRRGQAPHRRKRPAHPDRRDPRRGRRKGGGGVEGCQPISQGSRLMAILIDTSSRVLVTGLTGRIGSFHAADMIRHGTNVVGGVTPGKGGTTHEGLPVFNTVKGAVAETGADLVICFVPPPFAADAIMEAADAGIRTCVCIADGIPARDMIRVKRYMRRYKAERRMRLIGPNCAGIITPGQAFAGLMPPHIYMPGRVGIVGRSGTLGYEAASQMKDRGIGVSTSVGIGGDPINGSSFRDILELFENDPDTDAVVMVGEIGGPQEAEAAAYIRDHMSKPVAAYIAGLSAPKGRRMGHAGAID